MEITDKPFDRLIFIEKDPQRFELLRKLQEEFPGRDISVLNEDAEKALPAFCQSLDVDERAVVFLDPFATEVSWAMVEGMARTQKIDCWILFPLSAIARSFMPTPRASHQRNSCKSTRQDFLNGACILAGLLQYMAPQGGRLSFPQGFGGAKLSKSDRRRQQPDRRLGYRVRLASIFARVAPKGREFANSKNSPMFRVVFFAASRHPKGARIAVGMLRHISQLTIGDGQGS